MCLFTKDSNTLVTRAWHRAICDMPDGIYIQSAVASQYTSDFPCLAVFNLDGQCAIFDTAWMYELAITNQLARLHAFAILNSLCYIESIEEIPDEATAFVIDAGGDVGRMLRSFAHNDLLIHRNRTSYDRACRVRMTSHGLKVECV